jgi:hypothetical protein
MLKLSMLLYCILQPNHTYHYSKFIISLTSATFYYFQKLKWAYAIIILSVAVNHLPYF